MHEAFVRDNASPKEPAGQLWHVEPAVEYSPLLQGKHKAAEVAPDVELEPAGQGAHLPPLNRPPVEYVPGLQGEQADPLIPFVDWPAGQSVQTDSELSAPQQPQVLVRPASQSSQEPMPPYCPSEHLSTQKKATQAQPQSQSELRTQAPSLPFGSIMKRAKT